MTLNDSDSNPAIVANQVKKDATKEGTPELEMVFDINVLEHLGLKMYTSLPAVISEYIANSWDSGATLVKISIPNVAMNEQYTISIDDNGVGMDKDEVNQKFLRVGRNRRDEEGTDIIDVNGRTRRVMGRKGIGKLAGFGVAGRVDINTRRDEKLIEFRMDYEKMQQLAKQKVDEKKKTTYRPEVIDWGPTDQSRGTTVKLSHLKRERAVDVRAVRRSIARHFSVIGENEDFEVKVNGETITPDERDLKCQCEFVWGIEDEPIAEQSPLKVKGWIGTMKDPVPYDIGRGVVVMVRGKLGQAPSTLDVGGTGITGQTALAYLIGEVHADFLDEGKNDFIATGRRAIVWEDEPALTFREWLNGKIKAVCNDWVKKRTEKKMKEVRELPEYKERIAELPKHEKKIIDKILAEMSKRESVDSQTIVHVADFLAEGVEYKSFVSLSNAILEAEVSKPEILIEFFEEWELLDAIEMIRVVEGRINVIKKFRELVKANVKELPDLHDFLVDNPWLLDPAWNYLDDEVYYSNKLWEKFKEPEDLEEENRRIDFLCLGYGITLNIIELKRPESTIGKKELRQLEDYVDYVKTLLGSGPRSYKSVIGYIIGGAIARSPEVTMKVHRDEKDGRYVRTFADLETITWRVHHRFVEVLERKAKRVRDKRLLEGLDRLRKSFSQEPELKLEQQ
jgi:hypothetical protein